MAAYYDCTNNSGMSHWINYLLGAIVSPIWGSLIGIFGYKPIVLRSTATCLLIALMGFINHPWQLITLHISMGLFIGNSVTAVALMASQSPDNRLGYTLSWLNSGRLAGLLIGPIAIGLMVNFLPSIRYAFYIYHRHTRLLIVYIQ